MNVALLGDSIRLGYEPHLRAMAPPELSIFSPEENCRFSTYLLRSLHQWGAPWPEALDVVVWNCGLWDCLRQFGDEPLVPLPWYLHTLERIIRRIQLLWPGARQLFLTSTPTLEHRYTGSAFRRDEDIRGYNQGACQVMAAWDIPVLDLYAAAAEFPETFYADHVHYTPQGFRRLAEVVLGELLTMTGEGIS